MIPYSDLVVALRSWRERNGLPNFGVDPGAPASGAMAAAPNLPGPPAGTGLVTRTAPPMPPPGAAGAVEHDAETMDVAEEIDAQEIESEEIYENEGSDFAMAFGSNIQVATDPAADVAPADSGGGGYGGYDDDFAAEPAPSTGTQPGVEPAGKKPGKKKR